MTKEDGFRLISALKLMGYDIARRRLVLGLPAKAQDDERLMAIWGKADIAALEDLLGLPVSIGWTCDQWATVRGQGRLEDVKEMGWPDDAPDFLEAAHD